MGATVEVTQNITYTTDTTALDAVNDKLARLNELLQETKTLLSEIGVINITALIEMK